MEIEESGLFYEIEKITEASSKPVSFYWEAVIHTPDLDTDVLKMVTRDSFSDFEKNFADEVSIEIIVGLGVYAKIIYPNRNILEITLTKTPTGEVGDADPNDADIETERYKAVLVLDKLPAIEGTEMGQLSQYALDLQDIVKLRFQLFDKSLEKLRIATVGGIFRKTKTEDVVRAILTKESLKVKINDKASVDGINIVSASNQELREHIVIPQGIKLTSIPTYVQEQCGGIYSTGLGSYFKNKNWYVYPLFNTKRLNSEEKTLTIIKVPNNKYTGIERTYREEGGSIFILATEQSKFTDDGSTNFMNEGNGIRLADADQFMNGKSFTKDNKTVISRGKLNYEFINAQKADGSNNVQVSSKGIGSNPFVEYSKIASRDGGLFELVWENSNTTLLYPGMMTRVLYLNDQDMVELNGVLLCSQTVDQLAGIGITTKRHISTSHLTIFANRVQDPT